jgi:hypothetical protein
MIWLEGWEAIAGRIEGLMRAAELMAAAFRAGGSADEYDVMGKALLPELAAITGELRAFGQLHASELPAPASAALKRYLDRGWRGDPSATGGINLKVMVPLAALRSELEYLLRDAEVEGQNAVDLAFEHLRRIIAVVDGERSRWRAAFDEHETHCEQLGAVHLLSHGIWAFKVSATGAATDLVFADPIERRFPAVKRTARALVLTEWKRVKAPNEVAAKAAEARDQAARYSTGVLGGAELKRTRYVVLVCDTDLQSPGDVVVGAISYRHIVIPVSVVAPSVAARKRRHDG